MLFLEIPQTEGNRLHNSLGKLAIDTLAEREIGS
jgi:hypothetical protein